MYAKLFLERCLDDGLGTIQTGLNGSSGRAKLVLIGGERGDEQRQIMRKVLRFVSENIVGAVVLSEKFFPRYMHRANTFFFKTAEHVVKDNCLVPQNVSTSLEGLAQCFAAKGFVICRISPKIEPQTAESATSVFIDWFPLEHRATLIEKARSRAICKDVGVRDVLIDEAQLASAFDQVKHVSDRVDEEDIAGLGSYFPSCEWFG